MIRKLAALAALLVPVPVPANPTIVKIECAEGKGTGVHYAPGLLITARHVSANHRCHVGISPIIPIGPDPRLDFDIVRYDGLPPSFYPKIDCEGFKVGEYYNAIGHARGGPQRNLVVRYLGEQKSLFGPPEFTPLWGPTQFIPGMSGGGVYNSRGELTGIVNAYSLLFPGLSFSRALRDTILCS